MVGTIPHITKKFGGLVEAGECPECKSTMYKWAAKNSDGTERCGPVCMTCGHREMVMRIEEREALEAKQLKKQNAINRMKNSSMVQDTKIWLNTFDNYKGVDSETQMASAKAVSWANRIIKGETIHAIMTGKPGAGKTHLSAAMVSFVLEKSNYKKTCAIVSYQHLYDQIKLYMSDQQAKMRIQGTLVDEIKKCDFVVIDDLGAELGRMEENNQATDFNVSLLTSIVDARVNKATVYTTNLSSKQIIHAYGERVLSRMLNGTSSEFVIGFKNTADKRRHPIDR